MRQRNVVYDPEEDTAKVGTTGTWGADAWVPVESGLTYCSPACGFKCTKAAFNTAVKRGEQMAAKLGPGWNVHVWENMGWFVKVWKGVLEVYLSHPPGVSVFLEPIEGKPIGGDGNFIADDRSPRKAMLAVINAAKERRANLDEVIRQAEAAYLDI